jgi:hypothetical protein
VAELWRETGAGIAPAANFLALIELLLKARRDTQPPRYFLYVAREGARAWPVLREGRLPPEVAHRPGPRYEEVGGFPDRKSAQAAYERLEDELVVARRPVDSSGGLRR